jgi:hypothetical protein
VCVYVCLCVFLCLNVFDCLCVNVFVFVHDCVCVCLRKENGRERGSNLTNDILAHYWQKSPQEYSYKIQYNKEITLQNNRDKLL